MHKSNCEFELIERESYFLTHPFFDKSISYSNCPSRSDDNSDIPRPVVSLDRGRVFISSVAYSPNTSQNTFITQGVISSANTEYGFLDFAMCIATGDNAFKSDSSTKKHFQKHRFELSFPKFFSGKSPIAYFPAVDAWCENTAKCKAFHAFVGKIISTNNIRRFLTIFDCCERLTTHFK